MTKATVACNDLCCRDINVISLSLCNSLPVAARGSADLNLTSDLINDICELICWKMLISVLICLKRFVNNLKVLFLKTPDYYKLF